MHEQRKGDPTWGHQASVGFVRSLTSGDLRPVSELDRGFSSPRHPGEVVQSYYQASLVFELIEESHGFPAIVEMLRAYRTGATNEEAFSRALGVRLEDFDKDFEDFLRDRFTAALSSVKGEMPEMGALPELPQLQAAAATSPRSFVARMAVGQALFAEGRLGEAAAHFEAAIDLFPQYGGPDGAHWFLGRIREEEGETAAAISHYRALLRLNESHYGGRIALGSLLLSTGDEAGAAEALRNLAHVHPYEIEDHERLATLMETAGDLASAARERRAVVALRPVDLAAAHYQLARVLNLNGDRAAARRAVLAALELAPNYEEALDLLLELRRGGFRPVTRAGMAGPGRRGIARRPEAPRYPRGLRHGTLALAAGTTLISSGSATHRDIEAPSPTSQDFANAPYDGAYTFVRVRFNTGRGGFGRGFGRGGGPPWSHDYPYADQNFIKILDEISLLGPNTQSTNVINADDPDLHRYPIAYVSEPGMWAPTPEEIDNISNYLLKGRLPHPRRLPQRPGVAQRGGDLPGHPSRQSVSDARTRGTHLQFLLRNRDAGPSAPDLSAVPARVPGAPREQRSDRPSHGDRQLQQRHRRLLGVLRSRLLPNRPF